MFKVEFQYLQDDIVEVDVQVLGMVMNEEVKLMDDVMVIDNEMEE